MGTCDVRPAGSCFSLNTHAVQVVLNLLQPGYGLIQGDQGILGAISKPIPLIMLLAEERTLMMQPIPMDQAVVIIVEDNADNLLIAQQLVRRAGVKYVNGRASGRQFFKLLESYPDAPIHLVLLDIQIPHEDGYAILEQIRATPRLADTRVVAVTANIMPQDIARAQANGFDSFLGKPLTPERFPQQLARILAGEPVWDAH